MVNTRPNGDTIFIATNLTNDDKLAITQKSMPLHIKYLNQHLPLSPSLSM